MTNDSALAAVLPVVLFDGELSDAQKVAALKAAFNSDTESLCPKDEDE